MGDKLCKIFGISVLIAVVWIISYPFYRYFSSEDNKVYVEWVVYTSSGPINHNGTYMMRGNSFREMSYSDRNGVHCKIVRDDCILPISFIKNESLNIYSGFSDCDILKFCIVDEN